MNINHKAKKIIIPIFMLVLAAVLVVIALMLNNKPNSSPINQYTINARFDPESNTITANMQLTYYNKSKTDIESITLLLFPNAYNSVESAPFEKSEISYAYPNGFSSGGIEVNNIKVNNQAANSALSDNGQQLTVTLQQKLGYNKSVTVSLDFILTIPVASGRFGVIDNTVNLGNWYPIAAINKDGNFIYSDYSAIGDPFYSDIANYNISLTLPSNYTPAASSPLIGTIDGEITTWTANATGLRDYAIVFGTGYKVHSQSINGIKINCYYKQNVSQAESAVKAATDSIKLFNDLFGAYPYEQFNIVQTSFFIGGMEYPGIVFIDDAYFDEGNLHPLENVVVHECAHQWWYGSAGNDQINTPWIDEGLATYSTMLYYENYKDHETYKIYYKYYVTNGYRFHRDNLKNKYGDFSQNMNRPLHEYECSEMYNMLCYEKSVMMLQGIRELLGDDLFFANVKDLYTGNAGDIITKEEFINSFSRNSSKPISEFIHSWLEDRVHIQ